MRAGVAGLQLRSKMIENEGIIRWRKAIEDLPRVWRARGRRRLPGARLPPRTGILGERENRLAELACGQFHYAVQELVDPARCRIWERA